MIEPELGAGGSTRAALPRAGGGADVAGGNNLARIGLRCGTAGAEV